MTPEAQIAMLEAKVTELVERNRKLANQIVGYGDRMQETIGGIILDAKVEALRETAAAVELIDPAWDSALYVDGSYHPLPDWLRTRADKLADS